MSEHINRYFVDTEHIRGEPRLYWVADRQRRVRGFPGDPVTDATTSERKAKRECDELNASVGQTRGSS